MMLTNNYYRFNLLCHRRSMSAVRHWCSSLKTTAEVNNAKEGKESVIKNFCNIQMISEELYSQIFIDKYRKYEYESETVDKCRKHLQLHDLWDQDVPCSKSIEFKLPVLEGIDIDDHFVNIARQQSFKYKILLDELVNRGIPERPKQWNLQPGWTKYEAGGTFVTVPYPEESGYVFDVEVLQCTGQIPTMACAVSTKAWYSWCSPVIVEEKCRNPFEKNMLDDLIPLETAMGEIIPESSVWKEKLVVGHNVCYDRARIKEQYLINRTKLRFMDTMSLHIAVSGITSFQRAIKMSSNKSSKSSNKNNIMMTSLNEWDDVSSLNNLSDVYKLYCGESISKLQRDVFMKGTVQDVKQDFQNLMAYCANDVKVTHDILVKLIPMFYERFPHPVTLAGMLEMGTTYLPINENWEKYIKSADNSHDALERELKTILMKKADEALLLLENDSYKDDPWLWDLDWKVTKPRKKKNGAAVDVVSYPAWYKKLLYKESDENYTPGPSKISTSMRIVPKLLRLCWFGFPLHYSATGGWGYLVKSPRLSESMHDPTHTNDFSENGDIHDDNNIETGIATFPYKRWEEIWDKNKARLIQKLRHSNVEVIKNEFRSKPEDAAQDIADFVKGLENIKGVGGKSKDKKLKPTKSLIGCSPNEKCEFRPLPHKDGGDNNVGNPLAKDFLNKIEEGILTSETSDDIADKVVRISKMVSYWRNNRDRIRGQLTVWMKSDYSDNLNSSENFNYGAILPQVSISGTLTRRAVEPTWMTASNAYEDRVGSELKGMIQAPPMYHFVGSDVDSQELWIAAVIGDAYFAGVHGSTALGWMTLQGNKNAGTDVHSKTASLIGIDRDQAKVLNYGRIYGAGVRFAERLLLQFNRQMSKHEARSKANAMFKMTKGERKYVLNAEGQVLAESVEKFKNKKCMPFSKSEILELIQHSNDGYLDYTMLIQKMVWDNGTESHMFNRLEEIAQGTCPQTPILQCSISRSLVPAVVQNDFMTSRVNWVVQSSAVDYLHLMLTCMNWLIKKYDINARFSISVHDEVRYLVSSEDRYRVALALQITNILTRSFCSYQIGIYDLPQSVAFFSCVDVDKVLRKEVHHDCKTPSNPLGLKRGYDIPPGEAHDIHSVLVQTKGSLLKSPKH